MLDPQKADLPLLVVDQQVIHLPDVLAVLILDLAPADILIGMRDRLPGVTQFAQRGVALRRHESFLSSYASCPTVSIGEDLRAMPE